VSFEGRPALFIIGAAGEITAAGSGEASGAAGEAGAAVGAVGAVLLAEVFRVGAGALAAGAPVEAGDRI